MPSRKPTPARRIGANTSFLPASTGAFIGASGVSISIIFERQVARHLVAEQHADLVEQLAEALGRALLVAHQGQLVLHQRMIDDGDALHASPAVPRDANSKYRSVADDRKRRARRPARFVAREPPPGRPGAAFEHARERKLVDRRRRALLADQRRDLVEQRDGERAPFDHQRGVDRIADGSRLRGSRRRSTPASTNRPPLRYSARPVRPSMSVTVMPDHLQRLDQRIGEPLRQLVDRHEAVGGVVAPDRGMPPGVAERDAAERQPARPDRPEMLEQRFEDARRRQARRPRPARRDDRRGRRAARDPRARTPAGCAATAAPRRASSAARPSRPTSGLPTMLWKPSASVVGA